MHYGDIAAGLKTHHFVGPRGLYVHLPFLSLISAETSDTSISIKQSEPPNSLKGKNKHVQSTYYVNSD